MEAIVTYGGLALLGLVLVINSVDSKPELSAPPPEPPVYTASNSTASVDVAPPAPDAKDIEARYRAHVKTEKCDPVNWPRYELAEFFQSTATEGKITPYDAVFGDSYTRRNVPAYRTTFMSSRLLDYLVAMPKPVNDYFKLDMASEAETKRHKKTVFNASVSRDYACYKRLK